MKTNRTNYFYFGLFLVFTFSFSSCGKKTRTAPVQKSKTNEKQNALDYQQQQTTIPSENYDECVRNNCPSEAKIQLVLEGLTARNGFIGENGRPVEWTISVKNNQNRKMGIAIDPEANLYSMGINRDNTNSDSGADKLSKMKVNWSTSNGREGLMQIIIRDISRCEAVSKEGLVSSCANMNVGTFFDVRAKIPFKVAENMLSANTNPEGSIWAKVIGCLASGVVDKTLGSQWGSVTGGLVDGLFGGGKQGNCGKNVTGVGK